MKQALYNKLKQIFGTLQQSSFSQNVGSVTYNLYHLMSSNYYFNTGQLLKIYKSVQSFRYTINITKITEIPLHILGKCFRFCSEYWFGGSKFGN